MKKSIIFLLSLCFLNCVHQKEIPAIQKQEWEILYPEKRPFSHYRKSLTSFTKPIFISIVAVGDIMIGEHAIYYLNKYGARYPFDSTKNILTNAHFTIGNLEAPFANSGKKFDKQFNFKVPPPFANGLVPAGFDVVNLANNHILDYGEEALISTLNTLDSLGIKHCGAGLTYEQATQPAILDYNGMTVAFLGYTTILPAEFWTTKTKNNAGTCYPHYEDMIQAIKYCKEVADFTVVSFHWGSELRFFPKKYQKDLAHLAIDAGADLILGHHPHVLQGLEIYNNKLIIYSLGNFAFAQYGNKKTYDSVILKTYLTKNGLLYACLTPVSANNYKVAFQPRVLRKTAFKRVISLLKRISLELNHGCDIIDENGIILGR